MLASVHTSLGDQPQDMVRSATDLVLETLKSEDLKDFDKKREIETLVGQLAPEVFAQLVTLAKKITDYGAEDDQGQKDEDEDKAGAIDDDVGVAVVFDEDEDEDEDEDAFEVRSEDDDDDDEDEPADGEDVPMDGDDDAAANGSDDEQIVIGGGGAAKQASGAASDGVVSAREIDGFWLQRLIAQSFPDPLEAAEKTTAAMTHLASDANTRDVENALMELTDYDKFALVHTLVKNRDKIVWCTKLARSDEDEKVDVQVVMREKGVGWILKELAGDTATKASRGGSGATAKPDPAMSKLNLAPGTVAPAPRKTVDLESMAFSQGARLMSNKKCKLPEGSFKRTKKSYEEVHVPAPKTAPIAPGEVSVDITELPEWSRAAFKGNQKLNRVQSRLYPIAFGTDEPILLCAPTGAGKTNVAMLTILSEMAKHRDETTGEFRFEDFKIVYVAPMKALVQEMVGNFTKRLAPFGVVVNELTGDRQLTKAQIAETQIIVTTPEKWDVITRKSTDTSYTVRAPDGAVDMRPD